MSLTSRSRGGAGNKTARAALCFAALFACTVASCPPVRAEVTVPSFWFVGTRLIIERPQMKDGDIAVGSDDAGLAHVLAKLGATLAYAPGQKYAVVTSGDHRTISFTLGDTRFTVAGTTETAPLATDQSQASSSE